MANVAHSTLTGADLHEPKGAAAATSGQVYVANGAGSGAWTTPDPVVFGNKHIAGLTWSNAADATNDITVVAGTARDTTNTEDMTLSSSLTKRLDAAWAVGDNQGGLDTGAVANTTYHLWLIKRTDTDVVDALFSTSASAPTMPTNYTKKRRIGSFVRVAGVNQVVSVLEVAGGAIEVLTTLTAGASGACANTGTSYTLANFPTGVKFEAIGTVRQTTADTGTSNLILVWSPDQTGVTVNATTSGIGQTTNISAQDSGADTITSAPGTMFRVRTNTSAQVKIAHSNSSLCTAHTHGWIDYRRD